jgi:hypothetical protein
MGPEDIWPDPIQNTAHFPLIPLNFLLNLKLLHTHAGAWVRDTGCTTMAIQLNSEFR